MSVKYNPSLMELKKIKNEEEISNILKTFPPYSKTPGGKFKDLSNLSFGSLIVLYRVEDDCTETRKRPRYLVKCACGNLFVARGENISSGHQKSCGQCKQFLLKEKGLKNFYIIEYFMTERLHSRIQCKDCGAIFNPPTSNLYDNYEYQCAKCNNYKKDLYEGQKKGKLTIEKVKCDSDNHLFYWCRCECGNEVILNGSEIGHRQSCGKCVERDIIGKTFGKLKVISHFYKYSNSKDANESYYECECSCEAKTHIEVARGNLLSGHTQSCGCIKSHGEEKIGKILSKNGIFFTKQKTFNNCYINNSRHKMKFDFYANNQYLIEYDGEQHFYYTGVGWSNKENYLRTKERDIYKNQWCKENNIPLIRIPYTQLDNLSIKDLMLETTKFRVV